MIKGSKEMIAESVVNVGQRIRSLREGQNLSLRALSERSGLSINAISQIERGENSPTVSSLHLLASALGVSIADLFKDRRQQAVVFIRPEDRLRSQSRGVNMESLGIGLPNQQLEPFIVTIAPGVDNTDQPITHNGEELVYCVQGEIDYVVGGDIFMMKAGDSLIFDATQPHYFRNRSTATVQLLMVFLASGNRHLAHRLHTEMSRDGRGEPQPIKPASG
jgi:transcriptional regulator with XRE-family HTH domain